MIILQYGKWQKDTLNMQANSSKKDWERNKNTSLIWGGRGHMIFSKFSFALMLLYAVTIFCIEILYSLKLYSTILYAKCLV